MSKNTGKYIPLNLTTLSKDETKISNASLKSGPTGDIYVQFKEGTTVEVAEDILNRNHLEIKERRERNQFIVYSDKDPIQVAALLKQDSTVEIAEYDFNSGLTH